MRGILTSSVTTSGRSASAFSHAVLAVHGRAHHLDVRRRAQHAGEGLAHEGRVVDDEDADHDAPPAAAPPAFW